MRDRSIPVRRECVYYEREKEREKEREGEKEREQQVLVTLVVDAEL